MRVSNTCAKERDRVLLLVSIRFVYFMWTVSVALTKKLNIKSTSICHQFNHNQAKPSQTKHCVKASNTKQTLRLREISIVWLTLNVEIKTTNENNYRPKRFGGWITENKLPVCVFGSIIYHSIIFRQNTLNIGKKRFARNRCYIFIFKRFAFICGWSWHCFIFAGVYEMARAVGCFQTAIDFTKSRHKCRNVGYS